jgi:hypothetical protein
VFFNYEKESYEKLISDIEAQSEWNNKSSFVILSAQDLQEEKVVKFLACKTSME